MCFVSWISNRYETCVGKDNCITWHRVIYFHQEMINLSMRAQRIGTSVGCQRSPITSNDHDLINEQSTSRISSWGLVAGPTISQVVKSRHMANESLYGGGRDLTNSWNECLLEKLFVKLHFSSFSGEQAIKHQGLLRKLKRTWYFHGLKCSFKTGRTKKC